MIVITGAAGFIGSNMAAFLNQKGFKDLVLVDDFSRKEKEQNFKSKTYTRLVEREQLFDWLEKNEKMVQFIIHLGARTDTTEFNKSVFDKLNLNYSKQLWNACVQYGLPMIYASSAATYGMGELGYADDHAIIPDLKPLNPYGNSKNEFDKWVLKQERKPFFWAGLKFFNVYGPNEYHKGRMASVVFHAFRQISDSGKMNLFRSHNPDFEDGKQVRDFVYVKDVCDVIFFLMEKRRDSGIYNLGTGIAQSFIELTHATFNAMNVKEVIEFIDTPKDIRDKYQNFTEAKMEKLRSIGYHKEFRNLSDGVSDYVKNYLIPGKYI